MLFDKNGFYISEKSFNKDYDFAVNIMNNDYDKFKIYDPTEALKKGNLFPKLYDEYKNYKPVMPKVDSGREAALLEIQMLEFCINDLNLYLDLNPNDAYAYKIFKDYVRECLKKKEQFSKVYGPLVLENLSEEYEWSKSVWPWEEGRM